MVLECEVSNEIRSYSLNAQKGRYIFHKSNALLTLA